MCRLYVIKNRIINTLTNEQGIGVVEVILILVVLIALVLIFKTKTIQKSENFLKS